MKLTSKVGKIESSNEKIFKFLIDFDNFKSLIPEDKVKDWKTEGDVCTFSVEPLGQTGIKIIEKEPFSLIKLTSLEDTKYNFSFWIQLKQIDSNATAAKLTMDVDLNPMLQMMAKKPLQNFLDKLVDQLKNIDYDKKSEV